MQPTHLAKILKPTEFCTLRSELRDGCKTLVHCHGCFDIVHPGHIHHLRFAAEQGDRLVVSITSDRFVNKGPGRPMFNEKLRAENLAALSFVDWVIINDAPTSVDLLGRVGPDVYIKGAEYRDGSDTRFEQERLAVEISGGRVVFSDDEVVYSSTALIEALGGINELTSPENQLASLASTHDFTTHAVSSVFEQARGKRVVVLGESIIDIYAHCAEPEAAQEHPMLSLRPVRDECFDGGAAIIAAHLASMGLEVSLATPLGNDLESNLFRERMRLSGIDLLEFPVSQSIPRKIRYLVGRDKVMKIDSPVQYSENTRYEDKILEYVLERGPFDAMVMADFGFGLFSNRLASRVIRSVRSSIGLILGDVSGRRAQLSEMRGADVLCPCEVELRQMLGSTDEPLSVLVDRAFEVTGAETICVTRAANGLQIYRKGYPACNLPAFCQNPVDVLGCGDALLTAMAASLLGGADYELAGYIGSLAAAIAGNTLGNHAVGSNQIIDFAQHTAARYMLSQSDSSMVDDQPRYVSDLS